MVAQRKQRRCTCPVTAVAVGVFGPAASIHSYLTACLPACLPHLSACLLRLCSKPDPDAGEPGGARAICLSGGYEDDDDHGDWFWYTGEGGRDTQGIQVGAGLGGSQLAYGGQRGTLPAMHLWSALFQICPVASAPCKARFALF